MDSTDKRKKRAREAPAEGDQNPFWDWWTDHQEYLRRFCQRLLPGHPDDVEDVLGQTMLSAWEAVQGKIDSIANPKAWLTRVAYNASMDWWRERGRLLPLNAGWDEIGYPSQSLDGEDPEPLLLQRETQAYLFSLVEALPSCLRDAFLLVFWRGMSSAEAAAHLGISPEAVRKRIQEGRRILCQHLETPLHETVPPGAPSKVMARAMPAQSLEEQIARITEQGEQLVRSGRREIQRRMAEARAVHVTSNAGTSRTYHIVLDQRLAHRTVRVETLRKYVAQHPQGWKKRLELAHLLYATGRWQEATDEYRKVLARQPGLLVGWLRLGSTLDALGRPQEALSVYQAALRHARQPASRHYVQGLMAICEHHWEEAIAKFEQSAILDPSNPASWHALAAAYYACERPHDALRAYDEALKRDPDDALALTYSRGALVALGRWEEIGPRLARAVDLNPDNPLALRWLVAHRTRAGLVHGSEGEKTECLIRRARRLAPDAPDVVSTLAHFHAARGQWARALQILREFVNAHADCPQSWYHYGLWLFYAGRYPEAADAVLKAHALDPADFQAQRLACRILPYAGRLQELRGMVETMLTRFCSRWYACATAAEVLAQWLNEPDRALALSAQALQIQPDLDRAWLSHGRVLSLLGRYLEAANAMEEGWRRIPEVGGNALSSPVALAIGECYQALGEGTQARTWFQEAAEGAERMAAVFDGADAYHWLGRSLECLGHTEKAIQAYRHALARHLFYPDRQEVHNALQRLESTSVQTEPPLRPPISFVGAWRGDSLPLDAPGGTPLAAWL